MCEDDRCMILTVQDRKDIPCGEHPRWTACPARSPREKKTRYGHRKEGTQYRGVRREVICTEVKENPQQGSRGRLLSKPAGGWLAWAQLVKRAPNCHLEPQRFKRAVICYWLASP